MTMQKVVNGKTVPLTSADIAMIAARDAAWLVAAPARLAQQARLDGLKEDVPVGELVNRLATSTAGDLDLWFAANVTNLEQATAVLKTLCKIIALRLIRARV